jgi:hypothetical protein
MGFAQKILNKLLGYFSYYQELVNITRVFEFSLPGISPSVLVIKKDRRSGSGIYG